MIPIQLAVIDWQRTLMGEQSLEFLFEVLVRTIFVFGYTLVMIRVMGKRGMGNLTPFEFAIIVALGSAVGDPMFYDDVPLIPAMLAIAAVITLQRALARLTLRWPRFEKLVESAPRRVVREGVVDVAGIEAEQLSRDELFEALRLEGIRQLGEVELAYLEPSGKVSVIKFDTPRAGLCILPRDDNDQAAGEFCCECGASTACRSPGCVGCESPEPLPGR